VVLSSLLKDDILDRGEPFLTKVCFLGSKAIDPAKMIFISSSSPKIEFSFALHFYRGCCPFDKDGVKDSAVDTIVLYRVTKNQIDHIWVLEDDNQLLQNPHLGKDDILRCTFWTRVTFLSCRDLPGRVLFVYNNYELSEDKLGFGLGTTSFQETWEIAPDNRTD